MFNFSMLNQLLSRHTLPKQHRARIDSSVSDICTACFVQKDHEHFLFSCKAFDEER